MPVLFQVTPVMFVILNNLLNNVDNWKYVIVIKYYGQIDALTAEKLCNLFNFTYVLILTLRIWMYYFGLAQLSAAK